MSKAVIFAALVIPAVALATFTPAQNAPPALEKKHYNYSEWTKGRFSEAVTVTGPGRTIYLAGVGAEDENGAPGTILHKGDFTGQCKYAYDKIKRLLAQARRHARRHRQDGHLPDRRALSAGLRQVPLAEFGTSAPPAHTLLDDQPARLARHDRRGRRDCGRAGEVAAAYSPLVPAKIALSSLRAKRSNPEHRCNNSGLLRRFAPRNDGGAFRKQRALANCA